MNTDLRCCRVVVSCFIDGRDNRNNSPPNARSVATFLDRVIRAENENDSDIPYDLIIINHDVGFSEGNEYINRINNTETKNGKIHAINVPNKGLSFDGYNTAFENFRENYDYWIFSEDDHLIFAKNYYKILLDEFLSLKQKKIGFLCLAPISTTHPVIHSGGGFGLTTTEVLGYLYSLRNSLPCLQVGLDRIGSEIYFTHDITRLGFKLIENKSFHLHPVNYERCKDHLIHFNRTQNGHVNNNKQFLYQVGITDEEEW